MLATPPVADPMSAASRSTFPGGMPNQEAPRHRFQVRQVARPYRADIPENLVSAMLGIPCEILDELEYIVGGALCGEVHVGREAFVRAVHVGVAIQEFCQPGGAGRPHTVDHEASLNYGNDVLANLRQWRIHMPHLTRIERY